MLSQGFELALQPFFDFFESLQGCVPSETIIISFFAVVSERAQK